MENWIFNEQQQFEKLSDDEKKKKETAAHNEAFRIKENVELYVSPQEIVPGINTEGLLQKSDIFKNKPAENLGKENAGEIGEDYETPHTGSVIMALNLDFEKNEGKKLNALRNLFRDIPIIDLGGGETSGGRMIARMLEVSGYLAAEPHNWQKLEKDLLYCDDKADSYCPKGFELGRPIPFSVVSEDALTVLRRLPDHSVGVMSIGVDDYVLFGDDRSPERRKEVEKYISDVEKEIARVVHPKSAYLMYQSSFGAKFTNTDEELDNDKEFFVSEESILHKRNGFFILKSSEVR